MIDERNWYFIEQSAEKFRHDHRKSGAYWTIRPRFVELFDEVVTLRKQLAEKEAYIKELTETIEEMDRCKQ